jgi:hypothetical protein
MSELQHLGGLGGGLVKLLRRHHSETSFFSENFGIFSAPKNSSSILRGGKHSKSQFFFVVAAE